MRWLFNVFKVAAVLALLLAAIGLVLPGQRRVERSIEVASQPNRVWALVADPQRWPEWSPWLSKDTAMALQFAGAASEAGAEWRWQSRTQGVGHMRFDRATAPTWLAYTLVFDDWQAASQGDFTLEPMGTGAGTGATRVTWRLDARFGWNPLARWFGLGLDHLVGPDFEAGLSRLKVAVERRG